jgi:hypothetical protein
VPRPRSLGDRVQSATERVSVHTYVTPDVADALCELAAARDLSVSAVARELLRAGLAAAKPTAAVRP